MDPEYQQSGEYRRPKVFAVLVLVIFVVAALLLWHNVIGSSFTSDDFGLIAEAKSSGLGGILKAFAGVFFRPATALTLVLDHAIWGLNPVGYHLTNVLLHGVNAWLVFLFAARLQGRDKGELEIPLLAGLIFLLLPCHGEAVSWISGRTDVVGSTLALLSLVKYLDFREDGRKSSMVWSLLLFTLSVLAKESMLVLPFIVLAHTYYLHRRSLVFRAGLAKILTVPALYCLCLLCCVLFRWLILGTFIGGYGASVHLSLNLERSLRNFVVFPIRAVLPPLPVEIASFLMMMKNIAFLLPLVLLALSVIFWLQRRGKSWHKMSFLATAFIISLLPVLNLWISITDSQNERYLYLPSVFVSIFLVLLLKTLFSSQKIVVAIVLVMSFGWMFSLYRANNNWRVAGDMAKAILDDLSRLAPTQRLYILNVPDHIRGAYIFRNCLIQAVSSLEHRIPVAQGEVLIALSSHYSVNDRVQVVRKDKRFLVSSIDRSITFSQYGITSPGIPGDVFAIEEFSQNAFSVSIKNLGVGDTVAYFSNGRLHVAYPNAP